MAALTLHLTFLDLAETKAPQNTNLLFLSEPSRWLTQGVVGPGGRVLVVESRGQPLTHFANLEEAFRQQKP